MDATDTPQYSQETQRNYFVTPLRHPSHSPTRDGSPGRQNGLLNSWNTSGTGRKRSYKDLDFYALDPASQIQHELEARTEDEHADKRSRGPNWPLPSGTDKNGSKSSRNSRTPRKPTSQRGSARGRHRSRSSKFVEGSMRDRDSEAPPRRFLSDDRDMEDFMANDMHGKRQDTSEESNVNLDAGIERSKTGSMYRFGKAIANAFNPSVMWHGVAGLFGKEKHTDSPLVTVMEQRKALAEKHYAELKKQNFQGTNKGDKSRSSSDHSDHRDSGIDMMDSVRASHDHKREGLIFDRHGLPFLPPPPIPDDDVPSPETGYGSTPGTGKKSFMRRPSMPHLKKLKSRFSLPNIKKDPNSPLPTIENDEFTQQVKKKQSKKDLQKQAKLTKKISNLECQLDKARKELNKSKGIEEDEIEEQEDEDFEDEEMEGIEEDQEEDYESEGVEVTIKQEHNDELYDIPPPPPEHGSGSSRSRRFVPTLPSLPSERLLATHARTGQTPASRFPNRDLPPKTVNPNPLALSLEQALGMHDENEDVISPQKKVEPKKRNEKPVAAKTPAKKAAPKTPAKKPAVKKGKITIRNKATASSAKPAVNPEDRDEAVVSGEEEGPGINKAKKGTPKKRRKSSGNHTEDKRFKPGSEDDDDAEWKEAAGTPKKRVTRQSTGRRVSGASNKAVKSDGAKGNATSMKTRAQNKKENTKPSAQTSDILKGPEATRKIFDNPSTDRNMVVAQVLTPSIYNDLPSNLTENPGNSEDTSPASGVTNPVLFAEATAFAPEQSRIAELPGAPIDSSFAQSEALTSNQSGSNGLRSVRFPRRSDALSPAVPQIRSTHMSSPLTTLERAMRSMSPSASATLSTPPGYEGLKFQHSNASTVNLASDSTYPSRKDSLRPRQVDSLDRAVTPEQRTPLGRPSSAMSTTAVPLPRGSPVRGNSLRESPERRPLSTNKTNMATTTFTSGYHDSGAQITPDNKADNRDQRYEIKPLLFNGSPPKSRSSGSLTRPLSAHLEESNASPGSNSSPGRRLSRRTGNGSPKPVLKRAGREGPITVTPSKGRGVPPVPVIPEGMVGIRAVVQKAREENGKSVNLDDGWSGWDDDVF